MLQYSIKTALEQKPDMTGHYLYLVRDGETVLYVGMSNSPLDRLHEHLGISGHQASSSLGDVFSDNLPSSLNWMFETYTLADCLPLIEQERASLYLWYVRGIQDMTRYNRSLVLAAEETMIDHYKPCLNIMGVQYRNELPERYIKRKIANQGVKLTV